MKFHIISEQVAEDNVNRFNDVLKSLHNQMVGGIYEYYVQSSYTVKYHPTEKKFYRSTPIGQYVSTMEFLKPNEEDELYEDVRRGLVRITQVPLNKYSTIPKQVLFKCSGINYTVE